MNHLLGILLVGVMLIVGLGFYNQSLAEKRMAEARAYRIERMADAQAQAIMVTAIAPIVFITIGGFVVFGGIAIVVFGVCMVVSSRIENKPKVIERIIERQQIIYILPAGTPRRELWKLMSGDSQPLMIEGEVKRK
jgi:hypothetical protein